MLFLRAIPKTTSTHVSLIFHGRHGSRSLGRGSIVTLESEARHGSAPGLWPYFASKHGTLGLKKNAGKAQILRSCGLRHLTIAAYDDFATKFGSTW